MILEVLKYGHPMLRQKGLRVGSLDAEMKKLIADMFDTMYAAKGVGLAAQQVGHALQITVLDVRPATERPSTIEVDGQPADVLDFMPLVLINPEIKPVGDPVVGPEGCLSFPEMYADISRPEFVDVKATNDKGKTISFRAGGLLSRAIQHEVDHLAGLLFIDRMDKKSKSELRAELDDLQAETKARLALAAKKK
ncbi:MAG: peptide deformylase [Pedosphaera sp.]|nr:peptide deformylase [Pedosphaera sp.]